MNGKNLWRVIAVALTGASQNLDAAVIINGGFETADFSGWITQDVADPNPALNVQGVSGVTEGVWAVQSGFDGQPGTISISQDIGVLTPGTGLAFDYQASIEDLGGAARVFNVTLRPSGGGAPIQTFEIFRAPGGEITTSPLQTITLNLNPYAGQDVRLGFELVVPLAFGGPGDFTLDNVRLTSVPEPAATAMAVGAGLVVFGVWRRFGVKTGGMASRSV